MKLGKDLLRQFGTLFSPETMGQLGAFALPLGFFWRSRIRSAKSPAYTFVHVSTAAMDSPGPAIAAR
jgi:hypothetical protein